MKKILIGIIAAAAMVSCVKRETVEPVAATLGSATISGKVYVNTDFTNDTTDWETEIPATLKTNWENGKSVQVTLTYNFGHLDETNNNSNNGTRTMTTTTDASTGAYSFTVQTPLNGDINYSISFEEDVMTDVKVRLDSLGSMTGGFEVKNIMTKLNPYTKIEQTHVEWSGFCNNVYTDDNCFYIGYYCSPDFWALSLYEYCDGKNINDNYTVINGDVKTHRDIYYSSTTYHDLIPPTGSL